MSKIPIANTNIWSCFLEEEFRSQNSGVRINQSGIQTRDCIFDHQIYDLVGVLNPIIHPPVGLQFMLNSDSLAERLRLRS